MTPPKPIGKPLSNKKAEKMTKIYSKHQKLGPIQELQQALDDEDDSVHALQLAREVAKMPNLPFKLTLRLLKFCARVGSEDDFRQIVRNQAVELKTPYGSELLWIAVNHGQVKIAAMLIRARVDLSVRQPGNKRTLLQGVLRSINIKNNSEKKQLIRLMLVYGADINAHDSQGYTLLHDAIGCKRCPPELVQMILDYGANVRIHQYHLLDHLYWASRMKPQLLLRLIEHRVPNEKTRNQRGVIAIKHIINSRSDDALQLIKKILDLGVPLDTPSPFPKLVSMSRLAEHGPLPLLNLALSRNNIDVVKLLLEFGADPCKKNIHGLTFPILQATELKCAYASTLLIKGGASIHVQKDNGSYPIHVACQNLSFNNTHLLLNLGADVNVIDNCGNTPCQSIQYNKLCDQVGHLMIKHFALALAKGESINDKNMLHIQMYDLSRNYYQKCIKEIELMKVETIFNDISYYSLLSKNWYDKSRQMRNVNFVSNFEEDDEKRKALFPEYSDMLFDSFKIAEMHLKLLTEEIEHIKISFLRKIPDLVVQMIAKYSSLEKMKRCHDDYFMTLHEKLRNSEAAETRPLTVSTRYNCRCSCICVA